MAGLKNMQIADMKREKVRELKAQGIRHKKIAEMIGVSPALATRYGKDSSNDFFINDRCPITGFKNYL